MTAPVKPRIRFDREGWIRHEPGTPMPEWLRGWIIDFRDQHGVQRLWGKHAPDPAEYWSSFWEGYLGGHPDRIAQFRIDRRAE